MFRVTVDDSGLFKAFVDDEEVMRGEIEWMERVLKNYLSFIHLSVVIFYDFLDGFYIIHILDELHTTIIDFERA